MSVRRKLLQSFILIHTIGFWAVLARLVATHDLEQSRENFPLVITELHATVSHNELDGELAMRGSGWSGYPKGSDDPIDYIEIPERSGDRLALDRPASETRTGSITPDERAQHLTETVTANWLDSTPQQVEEINDQLTDFINRVDASDPLIVRLRQISSGSIESNNVVIEYRTNWFLGEKGESIIQLGRMATGTLVFILGTLVSLVVWKLLLDRSQDLATQP